jgi:hypothetical protein
MGNKKITELDALAAADSGDKIPIVDVSDTTQGAGGSTKYILAGNLAMTNPMTTLNDVIVGGASGVPGRKTMTQLTALLDAGTEALKGALELATNAEALTGTDTARALTPDDLVYVLTQRNVNRWTQTTGTFTATPASTSTITMTTDMTASIKANMTLKYVIGGVTYYGIVGAIASNLLTVWGAPLGGDVTALYYGGGTLLQLAYDATVNVDGTANTTALKTGTVYTLKWQKPTSYLVFYQAYQTTHDSHSASPITHGKVTIKINGTEVNTSAGGLVIAANATWYSTVIDIATAAYDINPGEGLTIVVTQGGTADGAGLAVGAVIVTP